MNDLGEPLSEEEIKEVIDEIASTIIKRRLETAAILFLEMNKPLSTIAGQGMVVAMPFLGPIFGPVRMARYTRFLQTRENVERLIQRIEEMAEDKK
jgi:hypothetical protein